MNNIEKIGKAEVIALFIIIISNNIIINIPTIIIDFTGTGAWLNVIYLTIICLIFMLFVCKFFKPFVNFDILDVSEFLGGKILKFIIAIAYLIFFMSFSAACLRYFANNLQNIYFDTSPLIFIILLFIIPIVISCRAGLKAISGTNIILIPITILSIFTLFFAASRDFVWQRLFPIFGYGLKETFLKNTPNIFVFNVVSYIYFLKPFLKTETYYKKISIAAVIMCGIYLLLSVVTLLMSFAFITQTDETLSLYLLTRLINLGKFLQRVDALFIFVWILAILSFLSLNVFIISHIVKKIINVKASSELVLPISAILFTISLSFKDMSTLKFIVRNIYKYYNCILVFIVSFLILLLAYIKKKKKSIKANNN